MAARSRRIRCREWGLYRSFAAQPSGDEEGKHVWNGLFGHLVTVVDVPADLGDSPLGFSMRFADSATGRVETAFVMADPVRNFSATLDFSVDGEGREQWKWVGDHPFLVVHSPALRLRTQRAKWHERTIVTLSQAVVAAP